MSFSRVVDELQLSAAASDLAYIQRLDTAEAGRKLKRRFKRLFPDISDKLQRIVWAFSDLDGNYLQHLPASFQFVLVDIVSRARSAIEVTLHPDRDNIEEPENEKLLHERLSAIASEVETNLFSIITYNKLLKLEGSKKHEKLQELGNDVKLKSETLDKRIFNVESEVRGKIENLAKDFERTVENLKSRSSTELSDQVNQGRLLLEEIKSVAAEQGVTQQAIYYQTESEIHELASNRWRFATIAVSVFVAIFAASTLFLHKLPELSPTSNYEALQLVAGKVLIFGVLSYMLILCSKNFLAHKHNSIVNKHRQNALMTFTSIVDAVGTPEAKDLVLTHASACIFSPQDTGYSKSDGNRPNQVVELIPKALMSTGGKDG